MIATTDARILDTSAGTLFALLNRDGGGFPSDTRDSAFGQVLAATVGRCRPEHRHAHSWVARGFDRRSIHNTRFNKRDSSFDRARGGTPSRGFLKYRYARRRDLPP